MPKRSMNQLQLVFESKVNERLNIMECYIAQIRRASEFASKGNISDSFNILSTVGNVYDVEAAVADFVLGSNFLTQLEYYRDHYLSSLE